MRAVRQRAGKWEKSRGTGKPLYPRIYTKDVGRQARQKELCSGQQTSTCKGPRLGGEEWLVQCCFHWFFSLDFALLKIRHISLCLYLTQVDGQNQGSHGDSYIVFGRHQTIFGAWVSVSLKRSCLGRGRNEGVSQLERRGSLQSARTQSPANEADETRPRSWGDRSICEDALRGK